MPEWVLEMEGLTRRFGEKVAVHRLNVQIARGEVFGFLGPNGAGKTTTVRLLNGVLSPSDGTSRVLGFDPVTQGPSLRRRVGVVTETPGLYEQLTARDNLMLFGDLYHVPREYLSKRVEQTLSMFGLAGRMDDKVGGYSKGMKQRLALARALIHDPELLFLDEPTSGLDPAAARQVTELLEQLSEQRGRTVFLCTHNLVEAQRLCDRVGVINAGQLIALGTPAELAKQLWRDAWLDIDIDQPPEEMLLDTLCRIPGVRETRSDGKRLTLHLDDAGLTPAIVRVLVEAGGNIFRVAPRERTLEDIYFELQANNEAER